MRNRRNHIRGAREYPRDFEYDAADNVTADTNGRGFRAEHFYDQYNRRANTVQGISRHEAGEHVGSFEYDLLGRVVTRSDGNWNTGYGAARKLKIESGQPRIIESKSP